ncbi:MAG: kelch repeat-containing protein, partial [Candidatus Thermoplasmatota archaeon]
MTVKGTGANALLELCSVEVNSWTNAAPTNKPSARQSHAMAGIYNDDNVLLFGGYDDTGWKDDTWVYNVSEDQWHYKSTKNKPPARSEHAMATVYNDDKVLLFGGNNATERKNDTWVYDASDNDWTQKFPKNAPSARNYHAIASIYNDDKILLFGGEDGTGKKDDTWVYDLSDNSWTQKLQTDKPSGRIYHTMATVYNDDKVVLFGGLDSTYKDDTWVYDLSNNEWKEKPQINKPPARIRHAMASFYNDDKVVLFGGSDAPGAKNDTWIYDLSEEEGNGKWEQKTQANEPSARQSHAMATVYNDDKVVLFGGYNATLYKRKDDTWVYNLSVYVPFGFFQSEYKDTGGSSNFVKINWNATVPTSTSLKFQIRTSDTQSNLSSENFFGPNGTTNSYYTSSGTIIWSGHKGDRWLQYKAYFSTTNLDKTPILNDVTVKYNIIPLEPTPISPANAQWLNNSKPTFSWKFNDADGTQEEYNVQIDNDLNFGSIDYTSNNISSSESSWTPMNPISDGIWYWRVRTKDNDGDWSDYNKDIWCLKIDTTPPKTNHTIVSGILGNNDWYKSDVKLELSSMDEGSGVYEIKYKINFGDWQKYTTQFTVSGDRKNIVSYYAIDNVGNMEEKNISIKIDTTAPISNHNISGILGDNDWYKSDVQLTLSSVDETSGVEEIKYKLNDGNWEIYTSPFLIFNEGKNVINYYAIDNAGNVETEKNTSFKIDKKAPYLEIIEPANG